MNEIFEEKIKPVVQRLKRFLVAHKIPFFVLSAIVVSVMLSLIAIANSQKKISLVNVDLASFSNVTKEEGRTVFSLSAKKDYLYKSSSKKGLEAAKEFIELNPTLSEGLLFPKDFSKNTIVTRQALDKNDAYLKRNNTPLTNEHYFFNQTINNVPVYGGVVTVHIKNRNEVYSSSGNISTAVARTTQKITDEKAKEIALAEARKQIVTGELAVKSTKRYYINERLMGLSSNSINHLTLEVEVASLGRPIIFRTQYFVDLESGNIIYSESQTRDVLERNVYNCQGGGCPLQRQEGAAAVSDADVNNVYTYFGTVYNYFFGNYSRDSYDNAGASYDGYVHASAGMVMHGVSVQCPNAFWNGYEMVFCSGLVLLDVTGHELTHALTGETAGLQYVQESGALNEAVSDIFGSAMDENWDIGEGLPAGLGLPVPLRSMSNPPARNNPDKLSSSLFYCGPADSAHDYGGVHKNSGVINKTFFLMTDGGSFNGCTINGIGRSKSHPVVYQALTKYLTPTSNFKDVYTSFMQACTDLYGSSSPECDNVNRAMQATELDQQPQGLSQSPICTGQSLQQATCSTAGNPSPNPTSSITPSISPSTTTTPSTTTKPSITSVPNATVTPTPIGGGYQQHGTPTPTPDQYFTCKPDPSCTKSGKNIQLCPLLCSPQ